MSDLMLCKGSRISEYRKSQEHCNRQSSTPPGVCDGFYDGTL